MRLPRTPRALKAVRFTITGLLAAIPGVTAILIDSPRLGLVAVAVVLISVLGGPFIDRRLAERPLPGTRGDA